MKNEDYYKPTTEKYLSGLNLAKLNGTTTYALLNKNGYTHVFSVSGDEVVYVINSDNLMNDLSEMKVSEEMISKCINFDRSRKLKIILG